MMKRATLGALAAAPMALLAVACAEETVSASTASAATVAVAEEVANPLGMLENGDYALDRSHASIIWKVSHGGLSNYAARFTGFDATVTLDKDNVENSSVTVTIDPASVRTDYPKPEEEDFDAKLAKGEAWFNADVHPEISFVSTSLEQTGGTTGKLTGDLTFLGVTKPVTLDVEFIGGVAEHRFAKAPAFGIAATGVVDRTEFGFDTYAPYLGEKVSLQIDAEFIMKK